MPELQKDYNVHESKDLLKMASGPHQKELLKQPEADKIDDTLDDAFKAFLTQPNFDESKYRNGTKDDAVQLERDFDDYLREQQTLETLEKQLVLTKTGQELADLKAAFATLENTPIMVETTNDSKVTLDIEKDGVGNIPSKDRSNQPAPAPAPAPIDVPAPAPVATADRSGLDQATPADATVGGVEIAHAEVSNVYGATKNPRAVDNILNTQRDRKRDNITAMQNTMRKEQTAEKLGRRFFRSINTGMEHGLAGLISHLLNQKDADGKLLYRDYMDFGNQGNVMGFNKNLTKRVLKDNFTEDAMKNTPSEVGFQGYDRQGAFSRNENNKIIELLQSVRAEDLEVFANAKAGNVDIKDISNSQEVLKQAPNAVNTSTVFDYLTDFTSDGRVDSRDIGPNFGVQVRSEIDRAIAVASGGDADTHNGERIVIHNIIKYFDLGNGTNVTSDNVALERQLQTMQDHPEICTKANLVALINAKDSKGLPRFPEFRPMFLTALQRITGDRLEVSRNLADVLAGKASVNEGFDKDLYQADEAAFDQWFDDFEEKATKRTDFYEQNKELADLIRKEGLVKVKHGLRTRMLGILDGASFQTADQKAQEVGGRVVEPGGEIYKSIRNKMQQTIMHQLVTTVVGGGFHRSTIDKQRRLMLGVGQNITFESGKAEPGQDNSRTGRLYKVNRGLNAGINKDGALLLGGNAEFQRQVNLHNVKTADLEDYRSAKFLGVELNAVVDTALKDPKLSATAGLTRERDLAGGIGQLDQQYRNFWYDNLHGIDYKQFGTKEKTPDGKHFVGLEAFKKQAKDNLEGYISSGDDFAVRNQAMLRANVNFLGDYLDTVSTTDRMAAVEQGPETIRALVMGVQQGQVSLWRDQLLQDLHNKLSVTKFRLGVGLEPSLNFKRIRSLFGPSAPHTIPQDKNGQTPATGGEDNGNGYSDRGPGSANSGTLKVGTGFAVMYVGAQLSTRQASYVPNAKKEMYVQNKLHQGTESDEMYRQRLALEYGPSFDTPSEKYDSRPNTPAKLAEYLERIYNIPGLKGTVQTDAQGQKFVELHYEHVKWSRIDPSLSLDKIVAIYTTPEAAKNISYTTENGVQKLRIGSVGTYGTGVESGINGVKNSLFLGATGALDVDDKPLRRVNGQVSNPDMLGMSEGTGKFTLASILSAVDQLQIIDADKAALKTKIVANADGSFTFDGKVTFTPPQGLTITREVGGSYNAVALKPAAGTTDFVIDYTDLENGPMVTVSRSSEKWIKDKSLYQTALTNMIAQAPDQATKDALKKANDPANMTFTGGKLGVIIDVTTPSTGPGVPSKTVPTRVEMTPGDDLVLILGPAGEIIGTKTQPDNNPNKLTITLERGGKTLVTSALEGPQPTNGLKNVLVLNAADIDLNTASEIPAPTQKALDEMKTLGYNSDMAKLHAVTMFSDSRDLYATFLKDFDSSTQEGADALIVFLERYKLKFAKPEYQASRDRADIVIDTLKSGSDSAKRSICNQLKSMLAYNRKTAARISNDPSFNAANAPRESIAQGILGDRSRQYEDMLRNDPVFGLNGSSNNSDYRDLMRSLHTTYEKAAQNTYTYNLQEAPNILGYTAFYRGYHAANKSKEYVGYQGFSMTEPGDTRIALESKFTIPDENEETARKLFADKLDTNSQDLEMVEKSITALLSTQLGAWNRDDLLTGDDIKTLLSEKGASVEKMINGQKRVISLESTMVFYGLGECYNESIGAEIGKITITAPGEVPPGTTRATLAAPKWGVPLGATGVYSVPGEINVTQRNINYRHAFGVGDTPNNQPAPKPAPNPNPNPNPNNGGSNPIQGGGQNNSGGTGAGGWEWNG